MLLNGEAMLPLLEIIPSRLNNRNLRARRDDRVHAKKHTVGRVPIDTRIDDLNVKSIGAQHIFQLRRKCFTEGNSLSMCAAGAEGDSIGWLRAHRCETESAAHQKKRDHFDRSSREHDVSCSCAAGVEG